MEENLLEKIFEEVDNIVVEQKKINKALKKIEIFLSEEFNAQKQLNIKYNVNLTKCLNSIDVITSINESIRKRKKQKIDKILESQDTIDKNLCFINDVLQRINERKQNEKTLSSP